jgi:rubrerythrin
MPEIDFARLDLRDALDLAILVEEEAKERYQEFTRTVGGRYAGDALEVFRRMVVNEEKHRAQLAELRKTLFADDPRRVTRDMIDEIEAPQQTRGRYSMSAHSAMEVAIDSEVKAYDFFSDASRAATDPKVRRLFMDLRDEEREHRLMLEKRLPDFPEEIHMEEEDPTEGVGSDPG